MDSLVRDIIAKYLRTQRICTWDICYTKNEELPGLFNVVAPCTELKRYIPVYRVFVNKQDAVSIAFVISSIFKTIQKRHPEFKNFSDAEENGLREALGDWLVDKVLRGCKFHFIQSAQKVAILVTDTEGQQVMFVAIAQLIPNCVEEKVNTMHPPLLPVEIVGRGLLFHFVSLIN